jgi:hypothetical protein
MSFSGLYMSICSDKSNFNDLVVAIYFKGEETK